MDNIDGVMGEFGKVRETFDYEYFKKSNNGMDYGDYYLPKLVDKDLYENPNNLFGFKKLK